MVNPEYPYHRYLLENIKERFGCMEMSVTDIVKTCILHLKDKDAGRPQGSKQTQQLTFNCSDALLYTCQSLFYTQLINSVKKSNKRVDGREVLDSIIA